MQRNCRPPKLAAQVETRGRRNSKPPRAETCTRHRNSVGPRASTHPTCVAVRSSVRSGYDVTDERRASDAERHVHAFERRSPKLTGNQTAAGPTVLIRHGHGRAARNRSHSCPSAYAQQSARIKQLTIRTCGRPLAHTPCDRHDASHIQPSSSRSFAQEL